MHFYKRYPIVFLFIFILWGTLIKYSYDIFKEIKDFTTEGVSIIINISEFLNFRAKELFLVLLIYFILTLLNLIYIQYIYINTAKNIHLFLIINFILIGIYIYISNIFFIVTIILLILAYTISWSLNKIYETFFCPYILFDENDIIYSSSSFDNESEAENKLYIILQSLNYNEKLLGEIEVINEKYYFNIIATQKIKINKNSIYSLN